MNAVEESWVLVGTCVRGTWRTRRLRYRCGEVTSVAADAQWAMRREETRGDVIGFMHTHPMGGLAPSMRDVRTMRAWCDAFGKRLLCVIETPDAIGGCVFDGYASSGTPIAEVRVVGKATVIGVESHGRKVPSRTALSRRGPARAAGGSPRDAVRRGRGRVQPRR